MPLKAAVQASLRVEVETRHLLPVRNRKVLRFGHLFEAFYVEMPKGQGFISWNSRRCHYGFLPVTLQGCALFSLDFLCSIYQQHLCRLLHPFVPNGHHVTHGEEDHSAWPDPTQDAFAVALGAYVCRRAPPARG